MELNIVALGTRLFLGMLLIPYFAWGIYTLRLRYRFHEDVRPWVEALTLATVGVFGVIEILLLRSFIRDTVYLVFAVLGLAVSSAALFGPMLISLLSRVLVDLILPADRSRTREPYYASAEALEREKDFEGALREYMVIARVFPREPTPLIRIGNVYAEQAQPAEAAVWFERALECLDTPEENLLVTNRLCEIYDRQLGRPGDALRLLQAYLDKYPETEYAESVRRRVERFQASA